MLYSERRCSLPLSATICIDPPVRDLLESAFAALQRGNRQAVMNILGAFQSEAGAQKNKALSLEDADGLIDSDGDGAVDLKEMPSVENN